jgi:hypothetical protein
MSNYLKKLIVEPGSKIRLKDFDPDYHGKHESRKAALPEIEENRQKMQELQYLMYQRISILFSLCCRDSTQGAKTL